VKYLTIPTEWLHSDLTYREMIVLSEIVNLSQNRKCTASNDYFSKTLNISKKNVSNVISSLQKKGYLTVEIETGTRNKKREISIHKKWTEYPQKVDGVSTKSGESKEINKEENINPLPPTGKKLPAYKPNGFAYPESFERLWSLYRVGDKWAAYKAYHRRSKDYSDEEIERALQIESSKEIGKRHFSTVLNGDIDELISQNENDTIARYGYDLSGYER